MSRLVSINTVNDPQNNVRPSREAPEFIREWLARHGVDSEIIECEGYYSVYGVTGDDPKVMFLAHFDTVPVVRERWRYDPFKLTIVGNRGYGRGALDDKSNVASLMIAVRELARKNIPVVFAFTGDEEIGGYRGARVIAERIEKDGLRPKYLLNADGAGMMIIVRRRKAFKVIVKVRQREELVKGRVGRVKYTTYYPVVEHAHAAYFQPGVDSHPLLAISSYIRDKRVYARSLRGVFVKSNVIPPEAELEYVEPDPSDGEVAVDHGLTRLLHNLLPLARTVIETRAFSEYGVSITPNIYRFENNIHVIEFDVRAMADREDVEKAFTNAVKELLPEAWLEVRTGPGKYLYTPRNARIVETLASILREHGYQPIVGEGGGASDSRYFASLIPEIVDFGPRGEGMHGDNEYVLISDLEKLPIIYQKFAEKITSVSS